MNAVVPAGGQPAQRITRQILDFLADVPGSREQPRADGDTRIHAIAAAARRKAFLASSSLALPPGPIGWLTVLPELVTIWKIQAQMVADIAAVCGRLPTLTREQMLYCLFRHAASQAVRDLVVRAGQRWIVHAASAQALRAIAQRIGLRLSQRSFAGAAARMLPVAGALGVGAYAWYDTRQVAHTAMAMFAHEIEVIPVGRSTEVTARRVERDAAQAARHAGL